MSVHPIPVLLVLGVGVREFHEYVLAEYAAYQPVVLMDPDPPAWARRYARSCITTDLADAHAAAAAARRYAADLPVAGVTTYLHQHAELAARIAQDLGLPGPAPQAAASCNDKTLTRRLFAANHTPSAASIPVRSQGEALQAAMALGYPVVVTPRDTTGTANACRADRPSDMSDCYAATASTAEGVQVEEYLQGPHIGVEVVVLAPGRLHVAAITRTNLGPAPGSQAIGHSVDAADPLLDDPGIRRVTTGALNTLGITTGVWRVETRLSPTSPRVTEVNASLGEDLIPLVVHLATGVSLPRAAAALATGHGPDLTVTRHQAAAVAFRYPIRDGRILHLANPHRATVPNVERLEFTRGRGEYVSAPPRARRADRLAHAVATGPNGAICQARARRAVDDLHIDLTPPMARTTLCAR